MRPCCLKPNPIVEPSEWIQNLWGLSEPHNRIPGWDQIQLLLCHFSEVAFSSKSIYFSLSLVLLINQSLYHGLLYCYEWSVTPMTLDGSQFWVKTSGSFNVRVYIVISMKTLHATAWKSIWKRWPYKSRRVGLIFNDDSVHTETNGV